VTGTWGERIGADIPEFLKIPVQCSDTVSFEVREQ
jgi:hypothetical protein